MWLSWMICMMEMVRSLGREIWPSVLGVGVLGRGMHLHWSWKMVLDIDGLEFGSRFLTIILRTKRRTAVSFHTLKPYTQCKMPANELYHINILARTIGTYCLDIFSLLHAESCSNQCSLAATRFQTTQELYRHCLPPRSNIFIEKLGNEPILSLVQTHPETPAMMICSAVTMRLPSQIKSKRSIARTHGNFNPQLVSSPRSVACPTD